MKVGVVMVLVGMEVAEEVVMVVMVGVAVVEEEETVAVGWRSLLSTSIADDRSCDEALASLPARARGTATDAAVAAVADVAAVAMDACGGVGDVAVCAGWYCCKSVQACEGTMFRSGNK